MKNKIFKDVIIPLLLGIAAIVLEILLLAQAPAKFFLAGGFIITIICSILLIYLYRAFDVCGWFVISNCGGLLAVLSFVLLFNPTARLDYSTIYILVINWTGVTLTCFIARLLDKKDKIKGFNIFFRLSSVIFMFLYIFALLDALFLKNGSMGFRGINLIPFKTIIPYVTGRVLANTGTIEVNLAGNILLFVPLGFYINITGEGVSKSLKVITLLAVPVIVEIIQYITATGISDIDDVILNFTGGLLGMLLLSALERLFAIIRKNDDNKMLEF